MLCVQQLLLPCIPRAWHNFVLVQCKNFDEITVLTQWFLVYFDCFFQ